MKPGARERLVAEAIRRYYVAHRRCAGHDIGSTVEWAVSRAHRQGVRWGILVGLVAGLLGSGMWWLWWL